MPVRNAVVRLERWAVSVFALPIFGVQALRERSRTLARQKKGEKPRLIYGPLPVISIKYMSQAMSQRGYEGSTFVYQVWSAHTRDDFDFIPDDLFSALPVWLRGLAVKAIGPFAAFSWSLHHYDIFHFFFFGGFLKDTPLRFLETHLLHLAGKKVVVMPYGADNTVPSHTRSLMWRHGQMMHYGFLGRNETETLRRIEHFSRHADFIVAPLFHLETMPRWDLLTTNYFPIDVDEWCNDGHYSTADGKNGCVSIVHAPNHRGLKGTDFLVAACRELVDEGYCIDLRLLEGLPNTLVKKTIRESDILVEGLIQGYALTAIEAMSMGKPVISNISSGGYYEVNRLYTGMDECPIVDASIETLKDKLRYLVTEPSQRLQLGEAGRQYVLKFHSPEPVGRMWDLIYRKVWNGEDIELTSWHPDRHPRSVSDSGPN